MTPEEHIRSLPQPDISIVLRFFLTILISPPIGIFIFTFTHTGNIVLSVFLIGYFAHIVYPFMLFVGIPTILIAEILPRKGIINKSLTLPFYVLTGYLAPIVLFLFVSPHIFNFENILKSNLFIFNPFSLCGLLVAFISYSIMYAYRK